MKRLLNVGILFLILISVVCFGAARNKTDQNQQSPEFKLASYLAPLSEPESLQHLLHCYPQLLAISAHEPEEYAFRRIFLKLYSNKLIGTAVPVDAPKKAALLSASRVFEHGHEIKEQIPLKGFTAQDYLLQIPFKNPDAGAFKEVEVTALFDDKKRCVEKKYRIRNIEGKFDIYCSAFDDNCGEAVRVDTALSVGSKDPVEGFKVEQLQKKLPTLFAMPKRQT